MKKILLIIAIISFYGVGLNTLSAIMPMGNSDKEMGGFAMGEKNDKDKFVKRFMKNGGSQKAVDIITKEFDKALSEDRTKANNEIAQLRSELEKVISSTKFNPNEYKTLTEKLHEINTSRFKKRNATMINILSQLDETDRVAMVKMFNQENMKDKDRNGKNKDQNKQKGNKKPN